MNAIRKHPEPKIGDAFGNVTIVALFRMRAWRYAQRAIVECSTCGVRSETYVYNLRRHTSACVKGGKCK